MCPTFRRFDALIMMEETSDNISFDLDFTE